MSFIYRSKIKKLDERKQILRGWKNAQGDAEFETQTLGYGLVLEGSREVLIFDERPPFEVGDDVEVVIRKVGSER